MPRTPADRRRERHNQVARLRVDGYWRPFPATQVLIGNVQQVLDEYQDYLPLTIRQIFYRLVAEHDYPKTEQTYQRLIDSLRSARYCTRTNSCNIPWEAIRDDSEAKRRPDDYANPKDFMEYTLQRASNYRTDRQHGQKYQIELRVEAAGGAGLVAQVAHNYGVPVYSSGGFDSVTAKHEMCERSQSRDNPTVILHIGDHDPSGVKIFEALKDEEQWDFYGTVVRLAITPKQARAISAPSAPAKTSPHSREWSGPTWQVEALPPNALQTIVQDAIENLQDADIRRKTLARERRDRNRLVNHYKKLPSPGR